MPARSASKVLRRIIGKSWFASEMRQWAYWRRIETIRTFQTPVRQLGPEENRARPHGRPSLETELKLEMVLKWVAWTHGLAPKTPKITCENELR